MQIVCESGNIICSPSSKDLELELQSLNDEGAFIILESRPGTYMQTMLYDDGFHLEYQTDDTDHHFEVSERLPLEAVIDAMTRYAKGNDSWLNDYDWQPLDLSQSETKGCAGTAMLVVGLVSLGLASLAAVAMF